MLLLPPFHLITFTYYDLRGKKMLGQKLEKLLLTFFASMFALLVIGKQ